MVGGSSSQQQATVLANDPDWKADMCTLESSKPVLVLQFSQGRSVNATLKENPEVGDPSLILDLPSHNIHTSIFLSCQNSTFPLR